MPKQGEAGNESKASPASSSDAQYGIKSVTLQLSVQEDESDEHWPARLQPAWSCAAATPSICCIRYIFHRSLPPTVSSNSCARCLCACVRACVRAWAQWSFPLLIYSKDQPGSEQLLYTSQRSRNVAAADIEGLIGWSVLITFIIIKSLPFKRWMVVWRAVVQLLIGLHNEKHENLSEW